MAADFSLGSVNILANLVHMPQGQPGAATTQSGTATAVVTLGAGIFEVADLEIGYGNATGSGITGNTTGTLNVNNNGLFPSGALVRCATVLNLGRTNGGTGATVITGNLNVTGGEVDANSITSGGGVSTITLNVASPSSTLVVSNTAGTLARPIGSLTMGDSILTVSALNSGATVVVGSLTVNGTTNKINISAVPLIGSYPATFPLIKYSTGAGGNFGLGTLPAGYTGTILEAAGVVQLRLTAGPVADLGIVWTGAVNTDWETSNNNWTFHGNPTNFFT